MEIPIRPISTDADYRDAPALADSLFDAEPGTTDGDRLFILVTRIEAYEQIHWQIDPPDPIDAIRVRMAEKNLGPRDLERVTGSRDVAAILARTRPLTRPMSRRIGKALQIPAQVLSREPRS